MQYNNAEECNTDSTIRICFFNNMKYIKNYYYNINQGIKTNGKERLGVWIQNLHFTQNSVIR